MPTVSLQRHVIETVEAIIGNVKFNDQWLRLRDQEKSLMFAA